MTNFFITYNNGHGKSVPGRSKSDAENFLRVSTPGVMVINETIEIKTDLKRRKLKLKKL